MNLSDALTQSPSFRAQRGPVQIEYAPAAGGPVYIIVRNGPTGRSRSVASNRQMLSDWCHAADQDGWQPI